MDKVFTCGKFYGKLLKDLSIERFVTSKARITNVKDLCIVMIYRWLTKSISGGGNSDLMLNEVKLNYLHGMTNGVHFDLGILMAYNLDNNMKKTRGSLFGRLYATNLARRLVKGSKGETILPMKELNMK